MFYLPFKNTKFIIILLLFTYNVYVSCIVLPTPTKTIITSQTVAAINSLPTKISLLKRDVLDDQDNLGLYQNWASICREGGNSKNVVTIAGDQYINNLWKTVTQTVNCGGGQAITVTKTITASSTSKPTSNATENSCIGQCWSDYLWRK